MRIIAGSQGTLRPEETQSQPRAGFFVGESHVGMSNQQPAPRPRYGGGLASHATGRGIMPWNGQQAPASWSQPQPGQMIRPPMMQQAQPAMQQPAGPINSGLPTSPFAPQYLAAALKRHYNLGQ